MTSKGRPLLNEAYSAKWDREYSYIVDFDECLSSPCLNSGTCTDSINSYTCSCVGGYEGDHCQTGRFVVISKNQCSANKHFYHFCLDCSPTRMPSSTFMNIYLLLQAILDFEIHMLYCCCLNKKKYAKLLLRVCYFICRNR